MLAPAKRGDTRARTGQKIGADHHIVFTPRQGDGNSCSHKASSTSGRVSSSDITLDVVSSIVARCPTARCSLALA